VARLRYAAAAGDDLINIAGYIARQSGSSLLAKQFTGQLRRKCADLAASPFSMGRSRPELRSDMRSLAFGNYVIFFRYSRNTLEVVNVLEGHRDVGAFFDQEGSVTLEAAHTRKSNGRHYSITSSARPRNV
jgi:toxin ParE1/3/4